MKCNILLKEAINGSIVSPEERAALNAAKPKAVSGYSPKTGVGIDINSKLETALTKIAKQYGGSINKEPMFRPETIRKLLQREGVSNKEVEFKLGEILQSNEKLSIFDIIDEAQNKRIYVEDKVADAYTYAGYTYNKQGLDNEDYQVRHLIGEGIPENLENAHFEDIKGSRGWAREYPGKHSENGELREVWRLDEIQSDIFQEASKKQSKELIKLTGVDYTDVKKILIVDALDQAIKHGFDTVVIPITRSANYLTGSTDVSKIYRDLNTGILPKIRKELDREGLKLDIKHVIGKETEVPGDEAVRALIGNPKILHEESAYKYAKGYLENMDLVLPADIDDLVVNLRNMKKRDLQKFSNDNEDRVSDRFIKTLQEVKKELFNPESFVITMQDKSGKSLKPTIDLTKFREELYKIDTIPSKQKRGVLSYLDDASKTGPEKVKQMYEDFKRKIPDLPDIYTLGMPTKYRWDALSILSALGLGEAYKNLKGAEDGMQE